MSGRPAVTVVIPAYARFTLLRRLLGQLADQTLAPHLYEVVVVDDGSPRPLRSRLERLGLPLALRVEEQPNSGAAAARHRGALAARGPILVFVDDDMQVGPRFLSCHLVRHRRGGRKVVLGRIRPGVRSAAMPLFERWHAETIDRFAATVAAGRAAPTGLHLYTGNVSLRRADYFAVGGFDPALAHTEDSELGLRLERAGVGFELAEEAFSLHESDRASLGQWRRRAFLYGVYNRRMSRKHPERRDANPWGALFERHPLTRPFLVAALVAPGPAHHVARGIFGVANALDRAGAHRAALAGTSVVFGIDYFCGLRAESGGLAPACRELGRYVLGRAPA